VRLGLDGKVAVVGGASAGLGYAVAEALAGGGARVLLVSRSQARIDRAVAQLRERWGDGVAGLAADLTDPATPGRVVAAARERGFVPVRIDLSAGQDTPEKRAVLASYNQRGLPLVVLHHATGEKTTRITNFIDANTFLSLMERVD